MLTHTRRPATFAQLPVDLVPGNLPVVVNDAARRGITTHITENGASHDGAVAAVVPLHRATEFGVDLSAVPRVRAVDVEDHPVELMCRLHAVGALVLTRLRGQDGALLVTGDHAAAIVKVNS